MEYETIHDACSAGDAEAVSKFIEEGVSVDAENKSSPNYKFWTPLKIACHEGHTAAAKVLLEAGASASLVDSYGKTPLYDVCYWNHTDLVKLLLKYTSSTSIHIRTIVGFMPLHSACMISYTGWNAATPESSKAPIVQMLLDAGADINATIPHQIWRNCPLVMAFCYGDYCTVKLLLTRGATIKHIKNLEIRTRLHKQGEIVWRHKKHMQ